MSSNLSKLGRYTVLRRLSSGGMGEVFVARQTGLAGFEKLVVLKTLRPDLADRQHFRDMFFEEARVSALARHANVVSVVDVGIEGGVYYIVMEYIEGWSLRQVLDMCRERNEALPFGHALIIAIDLAGGLDHIHGLRDAAGNALKLVHRDVSPENVMITVDGFSKLVDFGIAKRHGSPIVTEPGVLKGKARYLAPEQIRGGPVGPATDQFALASVMFEMATGEPLYPGKTAVEVMFALGRGAIRDARDLRPDLPDEMSEVFTRALARLPEDRYASCGELADELIAIQAAISMQETRGDLVEFLTARLDPPTAAQASPGAQQRRGTAYDLAATTTAGRQATEPGFRSRPGTKSQTRVSRLVGRHHEIERIRSLFSTGARLVTLLGPGGVGKTSLAYHHAFHERRDASELAIYFCDVSEADTADEFLYTVAATLSVPLTEDLSSEDAAEHIGKALAGRTPTLLILDNVEQVVATVAVATARWLQMAPGVRFLTTSREALNVSEEQRVDVPPLAREEAVDLLCQRVRSVRPGWSPNESDHNVAGSIVDRLDCLPLAIELAAARGGVLSMSQLYSRLTSGLDWLRSRRRDISMRHTSLVETIAWSWELLNGWERDALAQCSVFRGGFTLAAAEDVVVLPAAAHCDVIDVVQSLREKSLLYTDASRGAVEDELRFRMYESVRSFADEKLSGENRAAVRGRHMDYYLARAEKLAQGVDTADGAASLDQMAASLDNFSAVLKSAQALAPDRVARLVLAVERLLSVRGPSHLHAEWLAAGLACARASGDTAGVSRLLKARGLAAMRRGDSTGGWADLREAIELGENLGDQLLIAEACEAMCLHHLQRRELTEEVRTYQERAYDIYRQLCDRDGEARILGGIALYHQRTGEHSLARDHFDQAIALHERLGNVWAAGKLYGRRGLLNFEIRRLDAARGDLERSIAIVRQFGDVIREATNHLNLGCVELELGNHDQAQRHIDGALSLYRRAGQRPSQALAHVNLAVIGLDRILAMPAGDSAVLGGFDSAEENLQKAVAIARETEYHAWEIMAVGNLGILAQARGDLDRAGEYFALVESAHQRYPASWAALSTFLAHFAAVQAARGQLAAARKAFVACRDRIERGNHPHSLTVVACLEGFCDLAQARETALPEQARKHLDRARQRTAVDASSDCDLRIARHLLEAAINAVEAGISHDESRV